jgi:type IV fimbrial biogenesis protein FimT
MRENMNNTDTLRRAPSARTSSRGFTLIEMMIVLCISGLLLGLAMPNFGAWLISSQIRNIGHDLSDTLSFARSEAIMQNTRVTVCKSADQSHCSQSGGWEQGWIAFTDSNRNGLREADELLLQVHGPLPNGYRINGNKPVMNYVSFVGLGVARLTDGALQMGTIVVCRDAFRPAHVVLNHTGRSRVDIMRDASGCA